ncbi:hypothetical protein D3C80_861260 [compost metagenome]
MGKRHPVDRPGEALHVAGQVQFESAARRAAVRVGEAAAQVGVGQHAAAVVTQADARVVQFGDGRHGLHVDQRIAGLAGRVALHGDGRGGGRAVVHAGHATVVHARHLPVIHPGHGRWVHPALRRGAVVHAGVVHRRMIHGTGRRSGAAMAGVCVGTAVRAMIAMAHVGHAQLGTRIGLGYRRAQTLAHGQGAAGVAAAVHGLGEQGIGVLTAIGGDDHVVGFRHAQTDFVDLHRLDVLAVGGDHGELEAGDAEVEVAHRRGVDQAQADALARLEQSGPVAVRRLAVEQVGVGGAADVGQIGRAHVHLRPGPAFAEGVAPALVAHVADEVADRAAVLVVVVGAFLQLGQHPRRVLVGPVGEHHHVVALVLERLGLQRVDHQRAIEAALLLEAGVAVVPVGAALLHLELVLVHSVRRDAGEAEARHAVHVGRQQDAVPVDRGVLFQAVAHPQGHHVALAPAQQRRRQAAVDRHGGARLAGEVDRQFVDAQVELAAGQHARLAGPAQRPHRLAPQAEAGEHATGCQALDEGSSRSHRLHAVHVQSVEGRPRRAAPCRPPQGGTPLVWVHHKGGELSGS